MVRLFFSCMRYFLFFLSGLFFSSSLFSQGEQRMIAQLDSLGMVAYYQKDYPQAVHFFEQMLELIAQEEDNPTYWGQMKYVADLYLEVERYEEAEQLYVDLLDKQEKRKGTQNLFYVQCAGQLAFCYYGMGRYEEAEIYYLEALNIAKLVLEIDAPTYSSNLNNLALLYSTIGRYEEAEQLYLEVVDVDKKNISNKAYQAISLNNLAALYHNMGRYQAAKEYYIASQKIRKELYGVNDLNYALGLNNMATLHADMNRYFEAETYYIEARKLLNEEGPYYIYSLNASAKLYFKQKNYVKAESLWKKVLRLTELQLGTKHPAYAACLNDLANLYIALNDLETALDYAKKGIHANSAELTAFEGWKTLSAVTYFSNEITSRLLATCLTIKRTLYDQMGDKQYLEEEYEISKTAIELNERTRNEFVANSNKLRVLAKNSLFLRSGIEAALQLKENDYLVEAFTFAEQNKSIVLADVLKGQRARTFGDLPDSLALEELTLYNQKRNLQQKQLKTTSFDEKTMLATQLNTTNLQIDVFINSLKDKYPRYHALKYANLTASALEIQDLLDDKTLLLEYVVTDDKTYLFVVGKTRLELIPIMESRNRINLKINTLRNALSDYDRITNAPEEAYFLYTKSAEWLYQKLVQKALISDKIENLVVVSDGALGHVPFEVFLTQTAPQKQTNYRNLDYLVKDYNISYSYSASLWKENLKSVATSSTRQQILGFAATYRAPQHRLASLRSKHIDNIRSSLDHLPAAKKEVKGLSNRFQGKFLIGKEANEMNFKALASDYAVIHLAMHGVLNEQYPILSSLAFSENYEGQEDNFLQAYEIAQLSLNADMVVLSACETGYGKFEQGEGIMSLARSFMYTGVSSLVVSLWQVNDQSTSIIMDLFYQNLARGMNKAVALRQAKLSYLNMFEGIAAHPALWSAFVQLGDSRPIHLKTKRTIYWWILGLGGLLLGGAVWLFRFFCSKNIAE